MLINIPTQKIINDFILPRVVPNFKSKINTRSLLKVLTPNIQNTSEFIDQIDKFITSTRVIAVAIINDTQLSSSEIFLLVKNYNKNNIHAYNLLELSNCVSCLNLNLQPKLLELFNKATFTKFNIFTAVSSMHSIFQNWTHIDGLAHKNKTLIYNVCTSLRNLQTSYNRLDDCNKHYFTNSNSWFNKEQTMQPLFDKLVLNSSNNYIIY